MVDSVLDHLLPRQCLVCTCPCGASGICDYCLPDLPWNSSPCRSCGLPLPGNAGETCGSCLARPPPFQRTVSPLLYHYPVRQLVQRFKFSRDVAAGHALGGLLCRHLGNVGPALPELLLPVPLHPLRFLRRGFNQAYEIARQAGKRLGLPVHTGGLGRIRPTRPQSGLEAGERRKNLREAFAWRGRAINGVHAALVDDVMTTGATAAECSRVLLKAGAGRVDIWVIARAVKLP